MCVYYYDILAEMIEKKRNNDPITCKLSMLPKIETFGLRFQIVDKIVKPNVIQILQMF